MTNQDVFRKMSVWSAIARMSIPALVSILVMLLYNMTDMYFVARMGDSSAVASVAIVMPVFTVLMAISTLLGNGGCTLVAQSLGAGNTKRAKACSSLCVWACIVFGAVIAVLVFIFRNPLLRFLGANEDMWSAAETYLLVLSAGAPLILLNHSLSNIVRGEGAARQGMYGGLVATVTNIILDPVFITGLSLGVAGAAIATVLGNAVGVAYYLLYKRHHETLLTMNIRYAKQELSLLGTILALGMPNAVSSVLSGFASTFSNRLLVDYSTGAVAAMAAASRVTLIISLVPMGVCMGIQPLMAYCHGAQDTGKLKETLKKMALISIVLGLAMGAVSFFARSAIVGLFDGGDQAVRELGAHFVTIQIVTAPLIGFFFLGMSYLQASGKALLATIVSGMRQGVLLIPLLYLMEALFQLDGIAFAHVLADSLATIICVTAALIFLRKELQISRFADWSKAKEMEN